MRTISVLVVCVLRLGLAADNLEKTQKKALEAQVKIMTAEAARLEKAGQLAEARTKYAESQAHLEVTNVTEAIKRLDASVDDEGGSEEAFSEDGTPLPVERAAPAALKTTRPAGSQNTPNTTAGHRSSLCNALGELKDTLVKSPSATFNLANCAETN